MTFFTESTRKKFEMISLFAINTEKYLTWLCNKLFTVNIYIALESEFGGVGGVLILFIRFGSTQK